MPETSRCEAGSRLELPTHVRLVGKTSLDRDLGQSRIEALDQRCRSPYSSLLHVAADGAVEVTAEEPGEVNRMNSGFGSQISDTEAFEDPVVDRLPDPLEPLGSRRGGTCPFFLFSDLGDKIVHLVVNVALIEALAVL